MRNKQFEDASAALDGLLHDGMTIMAGGFGVSGVPENLIAAIGTHGARDLTIISNNCGIDDFGLGILLARGRIRKMVSSYIGGNKLFEQMYLSGALEVEFNPQGTLVERIRAGGAGIPAFFTRTGVGTMAADGKEVRVFGDEEFVMETALTADLAIVKAWRGDPEGNLIYRKTARNFNPVMATAGRVVVAEVEGLVAVGDLDPDQVHTPGVYVDRIVQGARFERRIERVVTRAKPEPGAQ